MDDHDLYVEGDDIPAPEEYPDAPKSVLRLLGELVLCAIAGYMAGWAVSLLLDRFGEGQ